MCSETSCSQANPPGVRLLFAMLAAVACIGCGGQKGPLRVAVKGSVAVDGQSLKSGMIRFIPTGQTKGPAAVAMIKNGAYALSRSNGPIVGMHRVEIEATDYHGFAIDDEKAYAKEFEKRQGQPPPKNSIPELYNRHSTLTADVKADGETKFDFQLATAVMVPNVGR